jgi:hypothetical protein
MKRKPVKVHGKLHSSLRYNEENETWVKTVVIDGEVFSKSFETKEEAVAWDGY